jgi:hypothetical protein
MVSLPSRVEIYANSLCLGCLMSYAKINKSGRCTDGFGQDCGGVQS